MQEIEITNNGILRRGETMVDRKLELVFIDKDGKLYPLDEVSRGELAQGLEKISKEIAKRLLLLKEQR
jgi:hypothetical protein